MIIKKMTLSNSNLKSKKYKMVIDYEKDNKKKTKTVQFGAKGMEDFTTHKDEERKKRYINRHIKNELPLWSHDPENLLTAAYYSRYLTWQEPTIEQGLKYIEDK